MPQKRRNVTRRKAPVTLDASPSSSKPGARVISPEERAEVIQQLKSVLAHHDRLLVEEEMKHLLKKSLIMRKENTIRKNGRLQPQLTDVFLGVSALIASAIGMLTLLPEILPFLGSINSAMVTVTESIAVILLTVLMAIILRSKLFTTRAKQELDGD